MQEDFDELVFVILFLQHRPCPQAQAPASTELCPQHALAVPAYRKPKTGAAMNEATEADSRLLEFLLPDILMSSTSPGSHLLQRPPAHCQRKRPGLAAT